ncbi:hypothetical protein B0T24DRAFT_623888 [Lasiosphaeria ovina]|uniref:Pre-mRNA splicing factor n=1 Tax=Lasiosphaeria ovina TaxID=92902 RepID=A0AAE0KB67_9PEZI|nr:hypothetical protein B0T24DRAFT_623888 [Lasiosphaeria ovina]
MTRKTVYGAALVAFAATTAMTIAAIVMPRWVSYSVDTDRGDSLYSNIGLHERCTLTRTASTAALVEKCVPFPGDNEQQQCAAGGGPFCSMWRTAAFLMSLAIVVELATFVAFLIVVAGGKARRESGWRILGVLLGIVAALEFYSMALVTYVFDHSDFFLVPGYRLDTSLYLCAFSGGVALVCACGLAISAYVLPHEDGYELLRDSSECRSV